MRTSGNGDPLRCAANLLKTVRGEVPYDRLLGVSSELVDRPAAAVLSERRRDIEWLVETYEPRVEISGWAKANVDAREGDVRSIPYFKLREEDDFV